MGLCGVDWLGRVMRVGREVLSLGLGLVELSLGLGDCVWCVLLPETVANATTSSRTTPPVSYN